MTDHAVNEWTSNDVPSVSSLDLYNKRPDLDLGGMRFGAAVALEAVVEHLNSVHPKPRPVTRQDLPDIYAAYSKVIRQDCGDLTPSDMGPVLDAVVEHLNANGGVPQSPDSTYGIPREDYAYVDWPATCAAEKAAADRAEADADRWRRAHSIVEGERDQARRERDKWEEKYLDTGEVLHRTRRERDEWKARAEAAEARTAAAVTRADIEKAIRARPWNTHGLDSQGYEIIHVESAVDAVCDLFGIEAGQAVDPLLDKAQEFAALADWELTDREAGLLHTVARHVLGQEASDGR